MRQFRYLYKSYMVNKHGYYTFIPHAKIFHPYFGLGAIGCDFSTEPIYNYNWMKWFKDNYFTGKKLEFRQKVKIFFPEVKTGVFYIDKIQHSLVGGSELDNLQVNARVETNSECYDYVEIKHHLAEFEIVYELDREYLGIHKPFEIKCDYIDILLFNQRISITITENTIKCVPYVSAHRSNVPLFFLKRFDISAMENTNMQLMYTLIFDKYAQEFLDKYNTQVIEVQPYMTPIDTTDSSYYIGQVLTYSTKFALDFVSNYKYLEDPNYLPMFSNEAMGDSCYMHNFASPWYYETGIYKNYFECYDVPGVKCSCSEVRHSADETRGNVWNVIMCNLMFSDGQLQRKAYRELPQMALIMINDILNDFYKKKPLHWNIPMNTEDLNKVNSSVPAMQLIKGE